jgi:hypothetical protein
LDTVRDFLIHSNFDSTLIHSIWIEYETKARNYHIKPLHVSAMCHNIELCEMLLFCNADVNGLDYKYHLYPHTIDSSMPIVCCIVFPISCFLGKRPPCTTVLLVFIDTLKCASCYCHTTPMSTHKTTQRGTISAPAFFIHTCQFIYILSCS